ncbi:hypothetical protein BD769DRAFT_1387252 [Suillus cothurnatus]|nr:hypothetical protein BD769DRAFT_1387252 [Suillus cothurnatus]
MTVSPLQIIHFQVPERHGSPMTMGSHAEAATRVQYNYAHGKRNLPAVPTRPTRKSVSERNAAALLSVKQPSPTGTMHTMINPSDTQGPSTRDPTAHHIPINPPRYSLPPSLNQTDKSSLVPDNRVQLSAPDSI